MKNEIHIVCEKETIIYNKVSRVMGFKNADSKSLNLNIKKQFELLRLLNRNKIDESVEFLKEIGNNVIHVYL